MKRCTHQVNDPVLYSIFIVMRSNINLLLLLCVITVATHAQELSAPSLNIGDPAPPLRLRAWLKGTAVEQLEKGKLKIIPAPH